MNLTRRDLLKKTGKIALGFGSMSQILSGCTSRNMGGSSRDEILRNDHYEKFTGHWDPIYGPPIRWSSSYGGLSNFQGHIEGDATPGVDYDVLMDTPLVPMMASYLRQATKDEHGSLYILLVNKFHPSYRISYGHLNRIFPDRRYFLAGEVTRAEAEGVKPLTREQVVALSGNSGVGLLKNRFVHPPHLHITLYYLNIRNRTMAYLDPDKFGLDGGRPVFWDGETILDVQPEERISRLELTLENLEQELNLWPRISGLDEVEGNLMQYSRLLTGVKGKRILDSKHFQDMRTLLKRVTLEEKRFIPGTRPYSLMLKVVGYSMDEQQEIILTLPFIAPGPVNVYKKLV